jgi:hypothetical protein
MLDLTWHVAMETLQFKILPVGSLVAIVTIVWLALLIRRRFVRDATLIGFVGVLGGAVLVAGLVNVNRLPYAFACLNCGFADRWWYSCVLTFAQGFGFAAGAGVVVRSFLGRRRAVA